MTTEQMTIPRKVPRDSTNDIKASNKVESELHDIELSVVMPCLNEAQTLGSCIEKALQFMSDNDINGEVVVADNGSTDGSRQIATNLGARVISISHRGYGNALRGGIDCARGYYVIMGDSDESYDFSALMPFVEKLREGYDLVMGNRFKGGIAPGAMPPLHKYLGNPVLTGIGRLFFCCPSSDFHCGLRGFRKDAVKKMNLRTTGMEFASEMVIKATLKGLKIAEVPTTLLPDGRTRSPHLRSWRDGWRHLRFMLLYSPKWLFLYPGMVLIALGLIIGARLVFGPIIVGSVHFDVQTMLFAGTAVIIGYQSCLFAIFSNVFGSNEGLLPPSSRLNFFPERVSLERGVVIGLSLIVCGLGGSFYAVGYWGKIANFGVLNAQITLRVIIPSITAIIVGLQTVLASFFLSILDLGKN